MHVTEKYFMTGFCVFLHAPWEYGSMDASTGPTKYVRQSGCAGDVI